MGTVISQKGGEKEKKCETKVDGEGDKKGE